MECRGGVSGFLLPALMILSLCEDSGGLAVPCTSANETAATNKETEKGGGQARDFQLLVLYNVVALSLLLAVAGLAYGLSQRRRTKHQEETGRSDEVVINMAATGARSGATSANINSYIDADDCRMVLSSSSASSQRHPQSTSPPSRYILEVPQDKVDAPRIDVESSPNDFLYTEVENRPPCLPPSRRMSESTNNRTRSRDMTQKNQEALATTSRHFSEAPNSTEAVAPITPSVDHSLKRRMDDFLYTDMSSPPPCLPSRKMSGQLDVSRTKSLTLPRQKLELPSTKSSYVPELHRALSKVGVAVPGVESSQKTRVTFQNGVEEQSQSAKASSVMAPSVYRMVVKKKPKSQGQMYQNQPDPDIASSPRVERPQKTKSMAPTIMGTSQGPTVRNTLSMEKRRTACPPINTQKAADFDVLIPTKCLTMESTHPYVNQLTPGITSSQESPWIEDKEENDANCVDNASHNTSTDDDYYTEVDDPQEYVTPIPRVPVDPETPSPATEHGYVNVPRADRKSERRTKPDSSLYLDCRKDS
ncbi:uncharacterized protein LOC112566760 isoform X2 [Pomacea canaliculata]|uniref:uncharacterized protein LOC112566760 isoform X2 n=1 Tax=Pomacea canaliculata TaxID=400727 RepID=UPI000D72A457|nr:uncharacterized protein LOC112566760 isoform X2 [Pomacea canaliculata]